MPPYRLSIFSFFLLLGQSLREGEQVGRVHPEGKAPVGDQEIEIVIEVHERKVPYAGHWSQFYLLLFFSHA